MEEVYDHNRFNEFIEQNKGESCALLLGNGLGLSHPTFKDAFNFKGGEHIEFKLGSEINCPEKYLDEIRKIASKEILKYYLDKLQSNLGVTGTPYQNWKSQDHTCKNFFSKFNSIFTLNYDPLTYFEILRLLHEDQIQFKDKFLGQEPIREDDLIAELKKDARLYFMHGCYFIQHQEATDPKNLRKLSDGYITQEGVFKDWPEWKPYLILEGRWQMKELIIKKHKYFRECYEQFKAKKNQNLLVFGVSFRNDEQLLLALAQSNYKSIYFTQKPGENLKKNIENKIDQLNTLKCPETQEVLNEFKKKHLIDANLISVCDNVIWDKK